MKRQLTFKYTLTAVLISFFAIISLMFSGGVPFAYASASPYSDALEDLRADATFTVDGFPVVSGDYSLKVIQIAESTDGELFIYVYQPAGRQDIKACTICIAREKDNSAGLGFDDYGLEYLNSTGVFFKYRVKDFELKADAIRFYNISSILRPFDNLIDDPAGGDNTVSEVPYPVGQFWTACTVGDNVTYTMTASEVITVTEKYVGHVNYDEGYDFGFTSTNGATSAHFVAFDTDRPIEKLISASVTFNERDVNYKLCGNIAHTNALNGHTYQSKFDYAYGDKTPHEPVKLTSECKIVDVGERNYTMNRIRTTSEFLADASKQKIEMTSGDYADVDGTKWVLNFYETAIEVSTNGTEWAPAVNIFTALLNGVNDLNCRYTEVSDVMILQLEFETDGQHYNLGVVDNKQTGSQKPWGGNENSGSGCTASWEWLNVLPWWAWILIVIFTPVVIFLMYKLIVWAVTAPFKKLSERRTQAAATSAKRKYTKGSTGKRRRKTGKKKGGKK